VDDFLRKRFHDFADPIDLCDKSGRVLARIARCTKIKEYDLEPKISQKEIERRSNSNGPWLTTEEVLAHLRQLEGVVPMLIRQRIAKSLRTTRRKR